ncbi:MAG: SGNH/GDSL hydrolase family protein [Akkermansiaceae bacterium]|nr:SGNH/GDSL hydrolase family protein [Akkermansiaceae bacterium]
MIRTIGLLLLCFVQLAFSAGISSQTQELSDYVLVPAPPTTTCILKQGDRLAICGDSITEQHRYSALLESYLTACLPELGITCRQYGWSGERASGFLKRLKSDVLRFKPTVATTCYGMNDFRYVPYQESIAAEYRENQTAIIDAFQAIDCRVVLGSPGIIDSVPAWVKTAEGTQKDLNLALARFRNINVEIAAATKVAFADIFQPMLVADFAAKRQYGADFKIAGKDGVHPGMAGQLIMVYGFLKGMGVNGDLGTITHDEGTGNVGATQGHVVVEAKKGRITLRSTRIPFSPGPGAVDRDDSIRAGLVLVPFDDELNRFILRIQQPKAPNYRVTWGDQSKNYNARQLEDGINLAKDFDHHPLVGAFGKVFDAVVRKQEYETRQIKMLVHGLEGEVDLESTFALTEKVRDTLEKAVCNSVQPVEHVIVISALP